MNTDPDFQIRQADPDDPRLLSAFPGQRYLIADRLRRQREERGVVLVAWLGREVVGRVYIWLDVAEEDELKKRLPGVALLVNVWVREDLRNRGIGTALVLAAENYLRTREHVRVALGVQPENQKAMRFYERLGYVRWPYPDIETNAEDFLDNGDRLVRREMCRVFVKDLG